MTWVERSGVEAGSRDQYDARQWVVETAYQFSGFSWQQEYHRKTVDDTETATVTDLSGGYFQAGILPNAVFERVPKQLEVALRYAQVDPNGDLPDDLRREMTLVLNWFFAGHRNKRSLDVSRLNDRARGAGERWENRVRLQSDVSF